MAREARWRASAPPAGAGPRRRLEPLPQGRAAGSEVLFARQRRGAFYRLGQDLPGLGCAAPAVELDPLALLQVLVVLEEMADALEPVRADLGDVVDVAVAGEHLVHRHGQDFLV